MGKNDQIIILDVHRREAGDRGAAVLLPASPISKLPPLPG